MCPRYTIGYCGYTHQHQPPGGSSSAAQDCPEDKGWVLLGARFPPGKGSSTGFWTWELKPPRPLNRVLPSSFHHLLPVTQHFCLWLPRFTTPGRFPLPSKTELKGSEALQFLRFLCTEMLASKRGPLPVPLGFLVAGG